MSQSDTFYSDIVRTLAEILNETHLTEIEYAVNDCKIRVARQLPSVVQAPVVSSPPSSPVSSTVPSVDPVTPLEVDLSKHAGAVKSPMVGMAYMAPSPTSDPYVSVNDQVKAGQTLMIIEAMKVMNQIKAHKDGVVSQILCQNGDPVEYDQVLVIIE